MDAHGQDAKALSSAIKDRRKDRAAKYAVPLPKVRGIAEEEMFKVIKTGKSKQKSWKRMVNKATFVGEGFTRKPVKLEVCRTRWTGAELTNSASSDPWVCV